MVEVAFGGRRRGRVERETDEERNASSAEGCARCEERRAANVRRALVAGRISGISDRDSPALGHAAPCPNRLRLCNARERSRDRRAPCVIPTSVRIFVCTERQDMRRSFDALALAVRERLALARSGERRALRVREQEWVAHQGALVRSQRLLHALQVTSSRAVRAAGGRHAGLPARRDRHPHARDASSQRRKVISRSMRRRNKFSMIRRSRLAFVTYATNARGYLDSSMTADFLCTTT